jgi:hypothetical protein
LIQSGFERNNGKNASARVTDLEGASRPILPARVRCLELLHHCKRLVYGGTYTRVLVAMQVRK